MTVRRYRRTPRPDARRFLVLGCGHTGTTLISGILHINGYGSFKVSRLFENTVLNDLNRRLLDGSEVTEEEIRGFLSNVETRTRGNWSLKDPRLSETVSRFYRHLDEPVRIIFNYRDPGAAVRSLVKEREMHEAHLTPGEMLRSAEDEWLIRNRASLAFLDTENRSPVLITRYDDLVDRNLDEVLCRFVGRPLDMSFIEPRKRRSTPVPVRQELLDLYDELNRRFDANKAEILDTTEPVPVKRSRGRTLRTRSTRPVQPATQAGLAQSNLGKTAPAKLPFQLTPRVRSPLDRGSPPVELLADGRAHGASDTRLASRALPKAPA